jgi:hypothetical protein
VVAFRERKDCLRAQRVYLVFSLWPQWGLDGAAFVHGPVALGLVERQGQVEDLAGLDLAVADQVDELGQEAAYRGGPRRMPMWEYNSSSPVSSTPWGMPTMPTKPPGRVERRAWVIDWLVPTHSSTASAPIP